jgi:hypothetical protein
MPSFEPLFCSLTLYDLIGWLVTRPCIILLYTQHTQQHTQKHTQTHTCTTHSRRVSETFRFDIAADAAAATADAAAVVAAASSPASVSTSAAAVAAAAAAATAAAVALSDVRSALFRVQEAHAGIRLVLRVERLAYGDDGGRIRINIVRICTNV